jgi:hypothetical protein
MSLLSKTKKQESFTEQEKDFLLKVLSSCKFEGKDVFLLSAIVNKLSDQA